MSKYNVFILESETLEETIDALNEISCRNPEFNPLLKPYQYLQKEHKTYLNAKYLNNKLSMFHFNALQAELKFNEPSKKVSAQVLAAYLKYKGFYSFEVKLRDKPNKCLTLWKHIDNALC